MLQSYSERRHEFKFVILQHEKPQLFNWLNTSKSKVRQAHDPNVVNNVYFDTFENLAVFENVYGELKKRKFRIRWYGNSKQIKQVRAEAKERLNLLVFKTVEIIDCNLAIDQISWSSGVNSFFSKLSPAMKTLASSYRKPVLLNRYSRDYFVSSDGSFRLTIDSDISYKSIHSSKISRSGLTGYENRLVCEVKFDESSLTCVKEFLANVPFARVKHSKFANGLNTVRPN